MLLHIDDVTQKLKAGRISLQELLYMRREVRAPFRSHPLGFFACTLLAEGSRKIRLHFWPIDGGAPQSSDCQIHDHLFEFRSWVLCGSVENVEYTSSQDGQEFAVYRTEYSGYASTLTKTGAARKLSVQQRYIYSAGSSYEIAAGVLHETVRIGAKPACTVLVTNDVSATSPIVLGPIDGPHQYVYQREVIDDPLVEAMLARA
jgi:hypothetical protein